MHEYSTFLFHSFINTPIVGALTKSYLTALCTFLQPIRDRTLFVDRALPLLVDCVDEIDASLFTSELTSLLPVQALTQRLLESLEGQLGQSMTPKEAYLSLHVLNVLKVPSEALLEVCEKELRRQLKAFQGEVEKPRVVRRAPSNEEQLTMAEIVQFLLTHGTAFDSLEPLMMAVLAEFHFYPLILSSIATHYSNLPAAYRTEPKLVSLLSRYACYVGSAQHTVRLAWLRLFLTFQQCDVGLPLFDDV